MSTERTIEGSLRALAEAGGPPDEDAAWQAIVGRIESDGRRRRRTRYVTAGLIGTAAAAGLVVAVSIGSSQDTAEPIDVGPAESGEEPQPTAPPTTEAAPPDVAGLPQDPIAVVTTDQTRVHVVNGETGRVVATPVRGLDGPEWSRDSFLTGAVIGPDGTLYVRIGMDTLLQTRWDGSEPLEETSVSEAMRADGQGMGQIALSPDGTTLAISSSDGTTDGIVLADLDTNEHRWIGWPRGDDRSLLAQPQHLSFSPDGSRLAFVNVHDTDGTEGFEGYVLDVDAATLADGERIGGELWDITFGPDGGLLVLEGDTLDDTTLRYAAGGPDVGVPPLGETIGSIRATRHAVYAVVPGATTSTVFRHVPGSERWDPVDVPAGFW